MNSFVFYSPTKIVFGRGAENSAAQEIAKFGGSRVLLVHSGGSSVKSGLVGKLQRSLTEVSLYAGELSGVQPNPLLSKVREGIELCRAQNVDFILAAGGGSCIDTAKAIALGVGNPDTDVWEFFENRPAAKAALPVGVVLTIPAAGSESSNSAVITDETSGKKRGYGSDFNRPKFAIINPELCATLPKKQIACGVVDIMMHTLERFVAPYADNYMSDKIALAVLNCARIFGMRAFADPSDYKAMSELCWAGSLSHNDITGLGNGHDMPVHALGHELSGAFGVYHGQSLSAIWPSFARYVAGADYERFAELAREVWQIDEPDDRAAAFAGISACESFFAQLEMPVSIPQLLGRKLDDEKLAELSDKATFSGKRKVGKFVSLPPEKLLEIYRLANE